MPVPEDKGPAKDGTRQAYLDVMGLMGIGATSYGAWLHYPPLGFMIGGGLLVALVIVGTLRS